jgi:hypothetical protein
MRRWLEHEGVRDTLRQVLPPLVCGCGAAAFHGLIRTAAALQAEHEGELADGLAYWAACFMPLGELPGGAGQEADPAVVLRRLQAGPSRAGLIAARMVDAATGDEVNAAAAALRIDEATPERLGAPRPMPTHRPATSRRCTW